MPVEDRKGRMDKITKLFSKSREYGDDKVQLAMQTYETVSSLTFKHWETHGCVVSTVATDVLVLKHQAISIHNAD